MTKKELPLVSVLIPSYNHAKYIGETIDSIINQTYKNIELIVIDDGSTDNSVEVLTNLSEKYNFILIVRENKGVSATMNQGIQLSKGKYFTSCASDDKFDLTKIEKQVHFMENNPQYAISFTDRIKFYENGIYRKITNKSFHSGYLFNDLISLKYYITAGSIMGHKKIYKEVGFYDTNLAVEDLDIILRIAKKYQIGYINEFLVYYRSHLGNTVNNVEKMEEESKKILDKWKNEENYTTGINKLKLIYFRNYASLQKIKAITRLPITIKVLGDKLFYEGLLRLLIPKFIYKYILKK